MFEYASHVEERRRSDVWYHNYESRQGTIGCTHLQVEDGRSDVGRYLLGNHGTASGWEAPIVMRVGVRGVGTAEIQENNRGRR